MTRSTSYDAPTHRAAERALGRRRLVAAVITVLALAGIAGGSAAAATAQAHDDRADVTTATEVHVTQF